MSFDRSKEMSEVDEISKEARRELPDSGARRQFDSGAVRDIAEGKGRCDLLPLEIIAYVTNNATEEYYILRDIGNFMKSGDSSWILRAISNFISVRYDDSFETAILELAKHYEAGAKKYDERNWEKGIPCHCYVDSGVRHLLKYYRGDDDEPHDRAFLWNMFGLLWTMRNIPNMNDLPCAGYKVSNKIELTEKDLKDIKEFGKYIPDVFEKEKK